ncbi:sensor domain-containing diguanylate cyclase [Massilia sp. DWR3-1-1]|uniref:sensor domain-containing diguanylate cyclase n=1 Tax=Massilia sp. DWR3-1-1 TaxID=2804559 RepID=UPI003CEB0BB4
MEFDLARLSEEHEALIQFLYLAPVGLVQASLDGAISMMNPVAAQLLMPLATDGQLENLFTVLAGVAPDLRHQCHDFSAAQGMVCDGAHLYLDPDRRRSKNARVLSLSVVKLGEARLMAVLNDVTDQVRRERELRQTGAWLNAILTGISDYAIVRLDPQGMIESWNESIGRVTGYNAAHTIGRSGAMFYAPGTTTDHHLADRLAEADRDGWSLDDGVRVRADGSEFRVSTMITPLREHDDGATTAYSMIMRDIGDKQPGAERERNAALRDYLTGLGNRRAFFEAAEVELDRHRRSPRPTALIMFDADHFKAVNDRHGHAGGDAVLRHLAAAFNLTFRDIDIVARVGGEEFAVLLPSTGLAGAAELAERLRLLVEQAAVRVDGANIDYTVSAGVAVLDANVTDLEGLMKRADQALYAAKAGGRNRVECWREALPAQAGGDRS